MKNNLRSRLLVVFFCCYVQLITWLYRLGFRGWLLNELPDLLVPASLRHAAAREYLRSRS